MDRVVIYTDGAARGNPGHSASGYCIYVNGKRAASGAEYNGVATNNSAEYNAVILALRWCAENIKARKAHGIEVYSDSELVVRQLNGRYKVKSDEMRRLNHEAKSLAELFNSVKFGNLPRSNANIAEVDARLNRLLDELGH